MSTQLFISWSGKTSHSVAKLLYDWIPTVLQSAEPFLSSEDINKGSRWSDHVAQKLEECGFGLIILTKDNLAAPWVLFEAGALSKMVGSAHVSALLIGIDNVDVKLPLSQFQNTIFSKDDVLKLIQSLNRVGQNPVKDEVLIKTFDALWPNLEASIAQILAEEPASSPSRPSKGPDNEIDAIRSSLGELIQTVQSLREEVKKGSTGGIEPRDLMREIRFAIRRSQTYPEGLLRDVATVLSQLESKRVISEQGSTFSDETMDDLIDRLGRISRHVDRQVTRPGYNELGVSRARRNLEMTDAEKEDFQENDHR